jgi:flavin-dependent dehydrogenase
MSDIYDCIVLGAGPAGATVATLVARAGHRTLLVERSKQPGAWIGQSLLPASCQVLERLGVLNRLSHSRFPRRSGLQFVNAAGEACPLFECAASEAETAGWHIVRSQFDPLLWEQAELSGVELRRETVANEVLFDGARAYGVCLQHVDRAPCEVRGRVIVDATGQSSLIAGRLNLRKPLGQRRKGAIWGEYRTSLNHSPQATTLIAQTRDRQSWVWYIPLADGRISVGVVGEVDTLLRGRGKPENAFEEELVQCPLVAERLMHARLTQGLWSTRAWFYSVRQAAGQGWVLAGDALAALDPILFSGVFLALVAGQYAADAILEALASNDFSAERLGAWSTPFMTGIDRMQKLAAALYDPRFNLPSFVRRFPHHHATLGQLLSGRAFDTDTEWLFDDMELFLHFGRELAIS